MVTDDDIEQAAAKALRRFDSATSDVWVSLGAERDDARQEAMIGAWKLGEKFDADKGSSLGAWLYRGAVYGLTGYYRRLKADRDKRSLSTVVYVGLDDDEQEVFMPESYLDDDYDAFSAPEVYGEESVEERELLAKLKLLLSGDIGNVLSDAERRAVCEEWEMEHGGRPLRASPERRARLVASAMMALRAEMRVREILSL